MADEWKKIVLRDITESVNTGLDAIRRAPIVLHQTDIKCLRIQDISQNKPLRLWGNTEVKQSDFEKYKLLKDDIIMARTCSTGINLLIKSDLDAVFNNGLARLRLNKQYAYPQYMYHIFQSRDFTNYINGISGGTSVQLNMQVGDLTRFELCLPPLPEQKAIAHILGTLDDKIELNRRMNETLEAMAQAIFKSWFVDITQAGLPEGWRESTIGEEVRVVGGSTPSTSDPEFWEGGTNCWATPKDLAPLTSPVLLDTERRITDTGVQQISSGLLPIGTVLLSSRAPIGYLALAEVPVAVNQGFIAMICDGSLTNHYVRLWIKQNIEVIKGRANGTTFMEISKSNFRPLPVLVPPQSVLNDFQKQVEPLHLRVVANLRESHTLAALRDTLLPKLISGEIRVKDAERFVEKA